MWNRYCSQPAKGLGILSAHIRALFLKRSKWAEREIWLIQIQRGVGLIDMRKSGGNTKASKEKRLGEAEEDISVIVEIVPIGILNAVVFLIASVA